MGTRADFYVGRGKDAEWIGSIGWDGYPDAHGQMLEVELEADFRARVGERLRCEDGTLPADGWPWPWDDSTTTDYAYAFDAGQVWMSRFGGPWVPFSGPAPKDKKRPKPVFPNMKARQKVTFGSRSGLVVLAIGGKEK